MKLRCGVLMIGLAFPLMSAHAAALSRTDQNVDYLFESGNNANVGVAVVEPSVKGEVAEPDGFFIGRSTGNVGEDFLVPNASVKAQATERIAVALGYDQPFAIDTKYAVNSAVLSYKGSDDVGGFEDILMAKTSGMEAHAKVHALTTIIKYTSPNNLSVYAGPVYYRISGNVQIPYAFYSVNLPKDGAWGYVAGVAYEKPEVALRTALTYRSSATYSKKATESFAGQTLSADGLKFKLPQSVNLDFLAGIMPKTQLITGVRWVNWKQFKLEPAAYGSNFGASLVSFPKDSWEFKFGVGRQLTEKLSGSAVLLYDTGNGAPVSPLGPPDKGYGINVGLKYAINKNVDVSGGLQYNWYKNETVAVEGGGMVTPVAQFKNMNVLGAGVQLGVHF